MNIKPVILAGGQGKRLWPLTSAKNPKPFIRFGAEHSFLQRTALRAKPLGKPVILCAKKDKNRTRTELSTVGVPADILVEPCAKSTGPAITLAAMEYPNDMLLILPCDHILSAPEILIDQVQHFKDKLKKEILIFGAPPSEPKTHYGYIEVNPSSYSPYEIKRFIEKPQSHMARKLLREDVFWNTGIFMVKGSVFLDLMARKAPKIYSAVRHDSYETAPNLSIDYALMEQAAEALRLIPLEGQWADLGTWPDLLRASMDKSLV